MLYNAVLDEVGDHDDAQRVKLPRQAPHVLCRPLVAALRRDVTLLLAVTLTTQQQRH